MQGSSTSKSTGRSNMTSSSTNTSNKGKGVAEKSSQPQPQPQSPPSTLSRYESQKRRDWNTFCQYLRNKKPPVHISECDSNHIFDFLKYLDQFGKTKVHIEGCVFFGQQEPLGQCNCPLKQAWGSLDSLIGRLRAAYEENGGLPETNPFARGEIRVFLRDVRDSQAKARGVLYKNKKKKRNLVKGLDGTGTSTTTTTSD